MSSQNNKQQSTKFSSKIGFILAAAGSAVGLGNIWRFPYLAAKYGGGIFLLVYLILAVTFGFTLMITEIAIGRKTGKSALYAFKSLDKRFGFIGVLESLVPFIIFPYYCVIGGWVTKYIEVFAVGQMENASNDSFFSVFISKTGEPIFWASVFIILTAVIVMLGVQKGIEKASKILMPVLVVLSVIIAIYGLTVDGAIDGLIYYIKPDFSKLSVGTFIAALGQLFYSMSLAMGIMITYGSYMKKEDNLETSVRQIEAFDVGIAVISGLIIIPSVFAFSNGNPEVLGSGPSLMFVALPKVFNNMMFGNIIGLVFFILVFFAALTSAISMMETIVSILQDKFKKGRMFNCIAIMIYSFIFAIPSSLGFGLLDNIKILGMSILDFCDFISNNILMPIVALLLSLFVGYVIKPEVIEDEISISANFKAKTFYSILIKYIVPVFVLIILISSVLNALGIISI